MLQDVFAFQQVQQQRLGQAIMPALLISTSAIWNMKLGRLLFDEERLEIHGVPSLVDMGEDAAVDGPMLFRQSGGLFNGITRVASLVAA